MSSNGFLSTQCTGWHITLSKTSCWLVLAWPALAWPGQAKVELLFWSQWEVLDNLICHPLCCVDKNPLDDIIWKILWGRVDGALDRTPIYDSTPHLGLGAWFCLWNGLHPPLYIPFYRCPVQICVGPFWARNQWRLVVSGPLGQVLDREGEQRREQGLLPQDEGRLLQIPGRGRSGRRPLV